MGNGYSGQRRKRTYQKNLQQKRAEAAKVVTLALRFLVYGKDAAGQGKAI